jgi:hypothetical protein
LTYHWLIPLSAALANLTLGFIVYRSKYSTPLGRLFSRVSILLALWNLNYFLLYFVASEEVAFSLTRPFRTSANFVPVAVLHIVIALRAERPSVWYRILALDYLAATVLAIATALDLVVTGLHPFAWGYY